MRGVRFQECHPMCKLLHNVASTLAILTLAGSSCADDKSNDMKSTPGEYRKTHWNVETNTDLLFLGGWPQMGGVPKGWDDVSAFDADLAFLSDPGGILTLYAPDDGSSTSISTTIDLPHGVESLTFLVRLRGPDIEQGDTATAGGGVTFSLVDREGHRRVLPRIDPTYTGYRNWLAQMRTSDVLEGERRLHVEISIEDCSGSLDVDEILVMPSDAESEATDDERNALTTAIRSDDADAVARLIETNPKLLSIRMGIADNGTPLTWASWTDSANVAAKLIELGADVEAHDYNWHNTPLRWCCWWGNDKVAAVLVEAGAETQGASAMAQNAKVGNKATPRSREDFDRVSEIINAHEEKQRRE